jgi:hypothetical protein
MNIVIVYESMFGNTRQVAEQIAAGLREATGGAADVAVMSVVDATPSVLGQPDVLIVGGPTHILRTTSLRSRAMARKMTKQAAPNGTAELQPGALGIGVREWLAGLASGRAHAMGAAFDTRLGYRFSGGASRSILRRLKRNAYRPIAEPIGFVVSDTAGPLREGELERAKGWGAFLASQLPQHAAA